VKFKSFALTYFNTATNALNRIPARLRFAIFLLGTILISLVLTGISYWLYVVSGTAQLDLSRPGYKQALNEVGPNNNNSGEYTYRHLAR
jgi:hypothetical protein